MLRHWDPIGVISEPDGTEGPLDEYDSYAPGVLKHLREGSDIETLAQHLNDLVTSRIGLERRLEDDREFAQRLISWWKEQRGSNAA